MKMVRLDKVTVPGGKSASLVMSHVCVCGAGPSEPSHASQPAEVPTCSECGGSRPRAEDAPRPERRERRHLQDFLSAFV